jgi:hypothetical protein
VPQNARASHRSRVPPSAGSEAVIFGAAQVTPAKGCVWPNRVRVLAQAGCRAVRVGSSSRRSVAWDRPAGVIDLSAYCCLEDVGGHVGPGHGGEVGRDDGDTVLVAVVVKD